MPDQSSAASEHAIIQEITAPLQTLPDDPVAVVNADFPIALRGYDRLAVDAYVQRTSQLVAELQATRSPEAAVRRALERVGEQISGILQRAHETAEEITAQSRLEAEDRLEQARVEAAEIAARAADRVKDLDADTDRIWMERHRIVDDARDLASQLLALAETAAQRFPDDSDEEDDAYGAAPAGALESPYDAEEEEEGPDGDEQEGHFESDSDVEAEHAAAYEEEDDVLDEEPVPAEPAAEQGRSATSPVESSSEENIEGSAMEGSPEEDVEVTRPFAPIDLDDTVPQEPNPPTEGSSPGDVIPPASQAAHRRPGE